MTSRDELPPEIASILLHAAAALNQAGVRWMVIEPAALALLGLQPCQERARLSILAEGAPLSCQGELGEALLGLYSSVGSVKWSWFMFDHERMLRLTVAHAHPFLDHASLERTTSVTLGSQTIPVAPIELLLINAARRHDTDVLDAIRARGGIDWTFVDYAMARESPRWDVAEAYRAMENLNRVRRVN